MVKILLIDDSKFSLIKHQELLQKLNCEVIIATSGQEGIELFIQERPNIVISDIIMPDLDGFEVFEEIYLINRSIPFYLMSAEKNKSLETKALNLGIKGYIQKPVNLDILKSALAQFLNIS